MSSRAWTRDDLRALVRDRVVLLRDATAKSVPVPDWLVEVASAIDDRDTEEMLEHIHPDDQWVPVDAFLTALGRPRELVEVATRFERDGVWGHRHLFWVNLLDDPDVAAIVVASEFIPGAPIVVNQGETGGYTEATPWILVACGARNAVVLEVEGPVADLLGYEPDELIGRRLTEFVHADAAAATTAVWLRLWTNTTVTAASAKPWVRKNGTEVWLESWYLPRQRADGGDEVLVFIVDITERRDRERALRTREEEFRLLAEEAPAAVFRCDGDGRVAFRNDRWDEVVGADAPLVLVDLVHPSDRDRMVRALRDLTGVAAGHRTELEVRSGDGQRVLALTLRVGEHDRNDYAGGGERAIVGSVEDVTATVELRRQAEIDALTGLLNRHAVDAHLDWALEDDPTGTVVVFVDLDGFKTVNDTYGHGRGDLVLVTMAERLVAVFGQSGVVARYGGDEFVLVLDRTNVYPEHHVARAVAALFVEPVTWAGGEWQPAASVGVARGETGDAVADLVRRADLAMFRVKHEHRAARNRVQAEDGDAAEAHLVAELSEALVRGDLALAYQPIHDLASGRVTSVEALLRWHHPVRGLVSPAAFIPLAERSGLIVPIGMWVLEEACREVRRWQRDHGATAPTVSVNLSVRQLRSPTLVADVATTMARAGVDPRSVTLEITETVLSDDPTAAAAVLHHLRDLGLTLALDDFGTGYNSLASLRELPVDVLKIDKSFVDAVGEPGRGATLVEATLALAGALRLRTVAEGIETPAQLAALQAMRCGHGQGYLLSRPLTPADLARYLADNRDGWTDADTAPPAGDRLAGSPAAS